MGDYTGSEYKIELLKGAKPYYVTLLPIPEICKVILKTEVNRLINIDVLKRINNYKGKAPIFVIPKKNGTICFISDFRGLNKRIRSNS